MICKGMVLLTAKVGPDLLNKWNSCPTGVMLVACKTVLTASLMWVLIICEKGSYWQKVQIKEGVV